MARYCKDCYKVGNLVLEMCERCDNFDKEEYYDEEAGEYYVDEEPKKVSKYYKNLTPEQIEEKMRRKAEKKAEDDARRAEKIRIANEALAKRLAEANVHKLLATRGEYMNLTAVQKKEHDILESFVKSVPKGLSIKEVTNADCTAKGTRGPQNISALTNYINYRKAPGYISIPLSVKTGEWLGCKGTNGEWIVSYHGTTLQAAASIVKTGFRAGTGQACQNNTNANTYSKSGTLGVGIYCSPIVQTAESYSSNKSYDKRYLCVLQCRVNPQTLKVGSDAAWVLNNSCDIQPYKLLIKKRY